MKNELSSAAIASVLLLAGYATNAQAAQQQCRTAVKYSGYELDISGLGLGSFKLGSAAWKPVQTQQMTALAQALDVMQFGDCQMAALYGKDSQAGLAYITHRDDVIKAMTANAQAFQAATTEEQANQALSSAQANVNKLAANTPKPGDAAPAKPSATESKPAGTSAAKNPANDSKPADTPAKNLP